METPDPYRERLDALDDQIGRVQSEMDNRNRDRTSHDAIDRLTEAVIAVAQGIRLLAEPPPVHYVEAPVGEFAVPKREDDEV